MSDSLQPTVIVWFRQDLRLADNPALLAAIATGVGVVPVYIFSPEEEEPWSPGSASRWWLHHSLASLRDALQQLGSDLVIVKGQAAPTLKQLAAATGATQVMFNRRYEPAALAQEKQVTAMLATQGIGVQHFKSNLLFEPWTIANKSGQPFQVFSAFWRHCLPMLGRVVPQPAPLSIPAPVAWPDSLELEALCLLPQIRWDTGLAARWRPGEAGAAKALRCFIAEAIHQYQTYRDIPALSGTSCLSPHLHFGEISPQQIWAAVAAALEVLGPEAQAGTDTYLKELGWREFGYHLLYHFPHTPLKPLRQAFEDFPWRTDPVALNRWQRGQTGFPIVDAGMRQLWMTGWMHNRVRMIVASFLVKDLLISWQEGAQWFWDTLVDADLANNTMGWQWAAGCGADAAPYFRVFNPVLQGEKFDPDGDYVRRWVPELRNLPASFIHQPWQAPQLVLQQAGVVLGQDYPQPIVDHAQAKATALAAFAKTRKQPATPIARQTRIGTETD